MNFPKTQTIDFLDIEKVTDSIFGNSLHAKRVESLSNAALGVITSASLIIHQMGHGLAKAKGLISKHAIKQVDRLISNEAINPWKLFSDYVPYVVGSRKEIYVAMDWTDFDGDNQATIALNLVTSHGRATPLLWKTVLKSELKNKRNDYEDEILRRLKEVLEEDVRVIILADRGFGDIRLYEYIQEELGFDFVIRFRGNIKVTNKEGETRTAAKWVGKGGRSKKLSKAKVTAEGYEVPVVICVQDKGMKEAWCLAASCSELESSLIIKLYGKRWSIDQALEI
jgi:Transposase DDE domain